MTKPAVTLKNVKTTPLTQAELDTNFTNLRDATIGIRAGTGGTTVTADLNGVITLVAGSGVTFTGDNGAKTITIDAASAADLLTNAITLGAADGSTIVVSPPSGFSGKNIDLNFDTVLISGAGDNGGILKSGGTGTLTVQAGTNSIVFNATTNAITVSAGKVKLDATPLELGAFTSAEVSAISSPQQGMVVFNNDTKALQYYDVNSWNTLIHADNGVRIPSGNNLSLADGNQLVFGSPGAVNAAGITAYNDLRLYGGNGYVLELVAISGNLKFNMLDGGSGTGVVEFTATSGTPSNTTTPQGWLKIGVGSTVYYLPLYS